VRTIDKQFLLFVQNDRVTDVMRLVDSGANISVANNEALTIASICGYFRMVKVLHILGADLQNNLQRCLDLGKKYKRKKFVDALEKYAIEQGLK